MKINIAAIPESLKSMFLGLMGMIVTYYLLPAIISVLSAMSIVSVSSDTTIKLITYFFMTIIAVISIVIYPLWALFEDVKQ